MGITTICVEAVATIMGGSGTIPSHTAIGTGSSTETVGQSGLLTESDRNLNTSVDISVGSKVTWISDFSATEISGTTIQEIGLFNSAAGGDMFQRTVTGSIEFGGERELQIQITHNYY